MNPKIQSALQMAMPLLSLDRQRQLEACVLRLAREEYNQSDDMQNSLADEVSPAIRRFLLAHGCPHDSITVRWCITTGRAEAARSPRPGLAAAAMREMCFGPPALPMPCDAAVIEVTQGAVTSVTL